MWRATFEIGAAQLRSVLQNEWECTYSAWYLLKFAYGSRRVSQARHL